MAPRAPTSTATTFRSDVAVERRRVELDVVDADDLAAVDVDDLLVEQVALEQQHAVGGRIGLPGPDVARGADGRAARLQGSAGNGPLAVGGADDQVRDAGRMVLRRDGDFAHTSLDGAAGIAHRRAEEFRQGDEGHRKTRQCHVPPQTVSVLMLSLNFLC